MVDSETEAPTLSDTLQVIVAEPGALGACQIATAPALLPKKSPAVADQAYVIGLPSGS